MAVFEMILVEDDLGMIGRLVATPEMDGLRPGKRSRAGLRAELAGLRVGLTQQVEVDATIARLICRAGSGPVSVRRALAVEGTRPRRVNR